MNKLLTWSAFVLLLVSCSNPWNSAANAPGAPRGDLAPGQARLVLTAATGRALLSDAGFVTLGLTKVGTGESTFATAAKAGDNTYTLVINNITAGDWRLSARFYPSSEDPSLLFYANRTLYIAPGAEQAVNLAVYEPGVIGGITLGEAGLPSTIEVTNFHSGDSWSGPQTLAEGLPLRVLATLRDAESNLTKDQRVEWASSNPAVASISSQGRLSPLKPGTATLTVTSLADRRLTASFEVTVEASVAGYWKSAQGTIVKIVANPVGASFRISVVRSEPLGFETGPLTTVAEGRYEILLNRQLSQGLWQPGPSYTGTLVDNRGTLSITGANFGAQPVTLERIVDPKPVTSLIVDATNPVDLDVTVVPADATISQVFWGSLTPTTAEIGLVTGVVTSLAAGSQSFLVSSLDNPQALNQVWGSPAEGWLPSVTVTGPGSAEANDLATFQIQTNLPPPSQTRWLLDGSVVSDRTDGSLAPLVVNTANLAAGNHQVVVQVTVSGQVYSSQPFLITGKAAPVSQVSSTSHTLYLKPDGTLWGWGNNASGQLGDGTTDDRPTPILIDSNVAQAAAGASHSLYLKRDGTVWFMGDDGAGQTGNGNTTTTAQVLPLQIAAGGVRSIAAGNNQSWLLKTDGTLWAAGDNTYGTLGAAVADPFTFTQAVGDVAQVFPSQNNATFVLKTDGTLWAAGYNNAGQLGDGTTADLPNFISVFNPYPGSIVSVAAGASHSVVVTSAGEAWVSGSNASGQIGLGGTPSRLGFIEPLATTGFVQAIAGDNFTVLKKADGTLWASGANGVGQLGDASTSNRLTFEPVEVVRPSALQGLFASKAGSYTVLDDGSLWANGANDAVTSFLGDGTTIPQSAPVPIATTPKAPQMVTNGRRTFVILGDGTLKATGSQKHGALGNGVDTETVLEGWVTITPFTDGKHFIAVAAGLNATVDADHTLFLLSDGSLWAAGVNNVGQLGDGSTTNQVTPVPVATGIKGIAAGGLFSMALDQNGFVHTFGSNSGGQLGLALGTPYAIVPSGVSGVTRAVALAAGSDFGLILTADGTVYSAGVDSNNPHGQAGVNATLKTPYAAVPGLSSVIAVEAGEQFSFAIGSDRTLYAAGWNAAGQLGVSSSTYPDLNTGFTPVWTKVKAVSAGGQHTLILRTDGTVWGTGAPNASGSAAATSVPQFLGEALSLSAGMNNSFVVRPDDTLWWFGSDELSNGMTGTQTATPIPQRVW